MYKHPSTHPVIYHLRVYVMEGECGHACTHTDTHTTHHKDFATCSSDIECRLVWPHGSEAHLQTLSKIGKESVPSRHKDILEEGWMLRVLLGSGDFFEEEAKWERWRWDDESRLVLTYIDQSLLSVSGVGLQDVLHGVQESTLVHPHCGRLEDNLRDPMQQDETHEQ